MFYGAIILAGGKGERFHGQKQFIHIQGKPMWKFVYDKVKGIIEKKTIRNTIIQG